MSPRARSVRACPIGVGVALAGKYLDELPYRVWVLCGDSEMAEGSIWEAFDKAVYYGLDNLTAIVDVNRLGQRGPTELGWDLDAYARRDRGVRLPRLAIDGTISPRSMRRCPARSTRTGPTVDPRPHLKGRGFSEVEDQRGLARQTAARRHGRAGHRRARRRTQHLRRSAGRGRDRVRPRGPVERRGRPLLPAYELGAKVATRKAYGEALAALGAARATSSRSTAR